MTACYLVDMNDTSWMTRARSSSMTSTTTPSTTLVNIGEETPADDAAIPSSSSSDSEELVPDRPAELGQPDAKLPEDDDFFVAAYVNMTKEDVEWLSKPKNKKKADIWLSKKMSEKGKEDAPK
jgi:hypothetical protein